MNAETLEGCQFSAKTHVRADGFNIVKIETDHRDGLHKWCVTFSDGAQWWYLDNGTGISLDSKLFIITRDEYARLNPVASAPEIPDSSPADPWAKSPITKEDVWLTAYASVVARSTRMMASSCGDEAIADFEARFLTPTTQE